MNKYDTSLIIGVILSLVCIGILVGSCKELQTLPPENTIVKIDCDKGVPRLVVSDGKHAYYVPVQDSEGFYECAK